MIDDSIGIWFCLSCGTVPFLSSVPVCPHCLGSDCAAFIDGNTGRQLTTDCERGRTVALAMGFDDEELHAGSFHDLN